MYLTHGVPIKCCLSFNASGNKLRSQNHIGHLSATLWARDVIALSGRKGPILSRAQAFWNVPRVLIAAGTIPITLSCLKNIGRNILDLCWDLL